MKYTMVVEQTKEYRYRMAYNSKTNTFNTTDKFSIFYARNFTYPYGWIKESGTPPEPHWDALLMSDKNYLLGDEIIIRVIGCFLRNDNDHKYVVVEDSRKVDDISQLTKQELQELKMLYPRVDKGEGWFGKAIAEKAMIECIKAY